MQCKIQGRDVWSEGPDVRSIADISRKWRKIKVALSDFSMVAQDVADGGKLDKFDWKRVGNVSWWLTPAPEGEMVFYLDEIRFTPR